MKRITVITYAAMMLLGLSTAASAYTITYANNLGNNGYTTTVTDATVNTLNTPADQNQWAWSGNYAFVSGSVTNFYAAPSYINGGTQFDQSTYLTVPQNFVNGNPVPTAPNSAKVSLGSVNNYLGLWWGSIDGFNTITLTKGGVAVLSLTGQDVSNPNIANGNQVAPASNAYVNFFNLPDFDGITFTSYQYAFEIDNIAVAEIVPEPGTMVLLGVGMLALAVFGKRRMNKEA